MCVLGIWAGALDAEILDPLKFWEEWDKVKTCALEVTFWRNQPQCKCINCDTRIQRMIRWVPLDTISMHSAYFHFLLSWSPKGVYELPLIFIDRTCSLHKFLGWSCIHLSSSYNVHWIYRFVYHVYRGLSLIST